MKTNRASDNDLGGVQTVTVTAQRRSESVQDVPITIQAITGEQLKQLNVTSFDDVVKYLPNVSFGRTVHRPGAQLLRYRSESRPGSVRALLGPLFRNRAFQSVCLLSFGATIGRETFNIWTPMYLHEHAGYSESAAAGMSAVFPAVGVISVLLSGWLSDRLGESGRSTVMFFGFASAAAALLVLTLLQPTGSGSILAVAIIGAIAFCVLGPYSYLGGAYALDFGGKQAGAAASGLIDGIGYLGGILAGDTVARIAVNFGWKGVFVALAVVCALAAASSAYLYLWSASAGTVRAQAS